MRKVQSIISKIAVIGQPSDTNGSFGAGWTLTQHCHCPAAFPEDEGLGGLQVGR